MSLKHDNETTIKLLLMGDSGTGKSSILLRFCDDIFRGEDLQAATIGKKYIKVKILNIISFLYVKESIFKLKNCKILMERGGT